MIADETYLYHWSIEVGDREFMIAVLHDGTMEWQELEALRQAGGDQYTSDFMGAIMGDEMAATRASNLISEFKIFTPGDATALEVFRNAGSMDDDTPLPPGLEPLLDSIFFDQFWKHVNPQLPDPLDSDSAQESSS